VLVAHSLGCLLVASWAAHSRNTAKVRAALLVAPGDAEREDLRPLLASWAPVTMQTLPFSSVLFASQNDPYCSFERASDMAAAWGAGCIDYGMAGHINADSGLGDWPEGHAHLTQLLDTKDYPHGD
jgi:predicted alpha/beta hydrolase family esterase